MDSRKELIADVLMKELGLTRVYLRNEAKSRQLEGLPLERGFLRGSGPTQVEIQEGARSFSSMWRRGRRRVGFAINERTG